ncbi:MAG TPA: glycosyltransferase, partial [Blastocatellia bacterium]|nr:glycosyltransferase [Blastocatellia bacterium]
DLLGVETIDSRIRIIRQYVDVDRIGALKYLAAREACGEILVELDHDDWLPPNALERVQREFDRDASIGMVYSNCARINASGDHQSFGDGFGWDYRAWTPAQGFNPPQSPNSGPARTTLIEVISPEPWPQNLSRIWYAPDHVRAWRTSEYWRLGGHDQRLKIADDHDLICRFWLGSKIQHIDECLYVYRITGQNNWLANCDAIQEQQWTNYDRYIESMALKWAADNGLSAIDLCGGVDPRPGYLPLDINVGLGGIEADLDRTWPVATNSVGVIRAMDAIEHLRDPIHTMNEAWRVSAHGGFFLIEVPSTDGRGAFCDPTHVSFWNELSFRYYTDRRYHRYISKRSPSPEYAVSGKKLKSQVERVPAYGSVPGARRAGNGAIADDCRFQVLRLLTYFPNEQCRSENIPYVRAHLIALKDGPGFHGPRF